MTVKDVLAALDTLVEMGVLHETARTVGPWPALLIDCAPLVPRIPHPEVDGVTAPDQIESETYTYEGREAA